MKILPKMIILLIITTIVPLIILGSLALNEVGDIKESSTVQISEMSDAAITDSTEALNNLGETIIRNKALDVAKELEIYIKANPEMTVEDLQNDEYFKSIAVQPVGETGYTAITDVESLICRFHASPPVVNLDLHKLAEKLPGFWGVMSQSEGGKEVFGYYDWAEADGSTNQKYMHIAIVNAATADGVVFSVAATTYIDEFSKPVEAIKDEIKQSENNIITLLENEEKDIKNKTTTTTLIILSIVVIIGLLFARSLTKPLKELTTAGNKIADGQLNTELPEIKSKDEIEDLSNTMNLLVGALKFLKKKK